jgi:peptidoglycan/LPS O-acetylase OafA/YrhL
VVTAFDPRGNSIGLLRIVFALTVIVSHTWPLGGFGTDPGRPDNNLGILAVEGFFALSGFLITGSAQHLPVGRFLWHRILRIFPGYWVALIVCAFGFGPLYFWRQSHDLVAYFTSQPLPTGYVINNWLLQLGQTSIAGTLPHTPFPSTINGPLYTLVFEFMCYLLVAVLAAGRVLNPRVAIILGAGVWLWLQLLESGVAGASDHRQALFTLSFVVGMIVSLLRERLLTRSPWIAIGSAAVAIVTYLTWGFEQVGVIGFAYVVIWVGAVLPIRGVGRKRDFSYGIYIYGWPVMQLCSLYGVPRLGLLPYLGIVVVITLAFAVASWYLIEKRALSLKNRAWPGWLTGRAVTTSVP